MLSRCISRTCIVLCACTLILPSVAQAQDTWYVDDDGLLSGHGRNWNRPFRYLQDALDAAASGDQIRIAGGTYKPDRDKDGDVTPDDPEATFQLIAGVALYGGYAGLADPNTPNARDIHLFETILSGNIGQAGNFDDNSYHVLCADGVDSAAILEGVTVSAGNAGDLGGEHAMGGGILVRNGAPTIRDCTFVDNTGTYGAAMCNVAASPEVSDCVFTDNSASTFGGGILSDLQSCPTVIRCTFGGNSAEMQGGAMANVEQSDALVFDCVFVANSAGGFGGGGMLNNASSPVVVNCTFVGNRDDSTAYGGGAVRNEGGGPQLVNCTFSANSAHEGGGILNTFSSAATIVNCVLWGNQDESGNGESAQLSIGNTAPSINYCCVQGWTGILGGIGNIGDLPEFVDAAGADGILGTADDDLQLDVYSPCIDVGDNAALPPTVVTDLIGNPRFADDLGTPDGGSGTPPIVDMGAYEFQGQTCFCDLDGDGSIDISDLGALLPNYNTFGGMTYEDGDVDRDGNVDIHDLGWLLSVYNTTCW